MFAGRNTYWGAECHGQTPGRSSPNKIPFVAALSKSLDGRPLALRLGYAAAHTPPMPYRLLKLAEAHW